MKTIIIYGSPKKLTRSHKPVYWLGCGFEYFVRVEKFIDGGGCEEALSRAIPMEGETVLNTIDIP